jgi:hypothetical protein
MVCAKLSPQQPIDFPRKIPESARYGGSITNLHLGGHFRYNGTRLKERALNAPFMYEG